jgi:hypothetical protein
MVTAGGFNDQVQKRSRCCLKSKAFRVNNSAGHMKPRGLRGRVFSFQAIACNSSWVKPLRAGALGYPLVAWQAEPKPSARKAGGFGLLVQTFALFYEKMISIAHIDN